MFAGLIYKKDHSLLAGISFGLTSGVITTLGILIGIGTVTALKEVLIAAIVSVAIADSLSDAMGIHLAKEAEGSRSARQLWGETLATFLGKFFFTLIFIIPVLLFAIHAAMIVSAIFGLLSISILSIFIARLRKESIWKAMLWHNAITIVVVILSYLAGHLSEQVH